MSISASASPIVPQEETAQTLGRLKKENEAQEDVLRSLKADLLPRSFSASSSLRVASGSSVSYFHVEDEEKRRWNFEFQQICASPLTAFDEESVHGKIEKINAFLKTFSEAMARLATKFLDQYLGEDDHGMALESEPITDGLTIALLDCEERTYFSIAAKDQCAQYRLLAQQIAFFPEPVVCVSPRAMISWKGRLLVVSADVIATSEPLTVDDCFEMRTAMEMVTETLGFKRYRHGGGSSGEEQLGSGPSGATAVRGADGRLYAHNLYGLYPYFPPSRGLTVDVSKHKVHLRPEAVSLCEVIKPLSPAAFVACGASDSSSSNIEVRNASAYVCQHLVPLFVKSMLSEDLGLSLIRRRDLPALVEMLHSYGINIALLAAVLFHLAAHPSAGSAEDPNRTTFALLIWIEMCSRCVRDVIQHSMSRKIESSEVDESVGEVLSTLATDADSFYSESLLPLLQLKFIGFASMTATQGHAFSALVSHVRKHLDTSLLVQRTMELLGISLKPLLSSALPTEASAYTVVKALPKVKNVFLSTPAVRKSLLYSKSQESGPPFPTHFSHTHAVSNFIPPPNNNNSINTSALLGRFTALRDSRDGAATRYLSKREEELAASGLFRELPLIVHSSAYIHSCYDMARGLAVRLVGTCGDHGRINGIPITIASLTVSDTQSSTTFAGDSTSGIARFGGGGSLSSSPPKALPSNECLAVAKEVLIIATNGINLVRDSSISSGSLFLKALLKHCRAVARIVLISVDNAQYNEALSDLRMALKILAPSLLLYGEGRASNSSPTNPRTVGSRPASSSAPRPFRPAGGLPAIESMSTIGTPRSPAARALPAAGEVYANAAVYPIYASDICVTYTAMLLQKDRFEEALPVISFGAEVCRNTFGPSDLGSAAVSSLLASVCLAKGDDLPLAEECLRENIAALSSPSSKKNARPKGPAVALVLSPLLTKLANILDRRTQRQSSIQGGNGDTHSTAESDVLHQQNIATIKADIGATHPLLAVAHNNYAASLIRRGFLDEADEQLRSAISILRAVHGTKPSTDVAETLSNIATLRRHQKRMAEAKATWLQSLAELESVGNEHERERAVLQNLIAWCDEAIASDNKNSSLQQEKDAFQKRLAALRRASGVA